MQLASPLGHGVPAGHSVTHWPLPSIWFTAHAAPGGQPSRSVVGAHTDCVPSQRQPLRQRPTPDSSLAQVSGEQHASEHSAPRLHGLLVQPAAAASPRANQGARMVGSHFTGRDWQPPRRASTAHRRYIVGQPAAHER
jgi:hypothetical protein